MVLVPFGDQLLQIAGAQQPHLRRGVRLEEAEEGLKVDPARRLQLARASGVRQAANPGRMPQGDAAKEPRQDTLWGKAAAGNGCRETPQEETAV
eukprot:scaffold17838_cov55-Phaeocystis_antarctica.AAC.2